MKLDGKKTTIEFNNYQRLVEAYIAPEVLFYVDDELIMKEEYYETQTPVEFPTNLFDEQSFHEVTWLRKF